MTNKSESPNGSRSSDVKITGFRHIPTFATTHWSVVLAAGDTHRPEGRQALEALCRTYWYPLYAFVRRHHYGRQDAEDLTQDFLTNLIEKGLVRAADRERGRFRTFLLTALKNFIADHQRRTKTQKRGGSARVFTLDVKTTETRYHIEPADDWTAEKVFEYQWAMIVLDTVYDRLRCQYDANGKAALFAQIKVSLTQTGTSIAYADLATRLHMTEGSVRVAVHRLRRRYRDLLREEIANTVVDPAEVEEEIQHLFQVLATPR